MSAQADKSGNTLNISGKSGLLNAFREKARELHGERGVSEAACDALKDWLAKHGVAYADDSDSTPEATRVKKLAALAALDYDVDALLDRALAEAGQPVFSRTGTGV